MSAADGDRMEQKYLYTAVAAFASVVFLIILVSYKEFSANWGGINVFICAGVLAPILMVILTNLPWFQSGRSAPGSIIALVVVGLILNVTFGIYFTEQPYYEVRSSEYVYEYLPNRNFDNINFLSNFLDCDYDIDIDSDGGIGLVILFLVVLNIILLFGSYLIPHFWVVSGTVLIAILGLLTLREYAVIEGTEGLFSVSTTSLIVEKILPNPEIISPKWKNIPSDKAKLICKRTYQANLNRQRADREKFFKE